MIKRDFKGGVIGDLVIGCKMISGIERRSNRDFTNKDLFLK